MNVEILQQQVTVALFKSTVSQVGGLVLSLRNTSYEAGEVVIGCPGLPNLVKSLQLGDAVLFESPKDGVIEVRVLGLTNTDSNFLITRVSPRLGFTAGLAQDTVVNPPFQKDEIAEIRRSVDAMYLAMSKRPDVSREQLDLIQRSLTEIADASQRLGRKDWIMFVAGTLSNICVGAAFAPEAAKALFKFANQSLGWVFQNALRLLS